MSVGDGIFLSAVLLSLVGLYAATKDRWNWKRLTKWVVGVPMLLIIVLGLGVWGYSTYQDHPTVQNEFGGIALTATPADVKFIKGEPVAKHSEADRWVYYAGSGSASLEDAAYIIKLKDGRIRWVMYGASPQQIITPSLQGFYVGTPYETVIAKLGPPSHTFTSKNGLERLLSYEKYHTFYSFVQAKVQTYGVYNPTLGPMRFAAEAAEPAASEASK